MRGTFRSAAGHTSVISSAVPTWVRLSGCFACVAADGVSCVGVVWVRDGVRMDSVRLRHTHKRGPYLYAPRLSPCYTVLMLPHTLAEHDDTHAQALQRFCRALPRTPTESTRTSTHVILVDVFMIAILTYRVISTTYNTLSPRSPPSRPCRATDRRFWTTDDGSCNTGFLPCCYTPRLARVRR